MTNTNDFRRYSYQYDPSYLINSFDVSRSSAVPKRKPQALPEEETTFTVRENVKYKTANEIALEEKLSAKKALLVLLSAICIIAVVGLTLHSFALKNELTREISSLQTNISNAQSENISLQSQLDAMVSVGTIETYAVEQLHMTKMSSNQVQYMDVNEFKQNYENNLQKSPAQVAKQMSNK